MNSINFAKLNYCQSPGICYPKAAMKLPTLFAIALSAPAFAGTSAKEVIAPAAVPAEPSLWSWFAGASVGYLVDFEEPMYHLHAGVDTPWTVGGFNVALFGEVGYTEKEESETFSYFDSNLTAPALINETLNFDIEIIPVTFNIKLERPIADNLSFYVGAGVGAAFIDMDVSSSLGGSASDDDTVFVAQIFTGVAYNVSDSFEIYGGARWIYLDDAEFDGIDVDLGDDFLIEAGLRLNF